MSDTLKLVLKYIAYDVMVTGEKKSEFRRFSKWMKVRLYNEKGEERKYKYVEFYRGYSKDRSKFKALYKGFEIKKKINKTYSNGLIVAMDDVYVIKFQIL